MKTDVIPPAPSSLGLAVEECAQAARTGLHTYAHKLARIEAALARMDKGCYGRCVVCEGRIGLARLEADPAEAMCEACNMGRDSVR